MQIQSLIDEVIMYTSNEVEVQFLRQPSAINCFFIIASITEERKKKKRITAVLEFVLRSGGRVGPPDGAVWPVSIFLYRLSSTLEKMLLDSLDSNWKMGLEHFYLLGRREGGRRFNDEQKVPKR